VEQKLKQPLQLCILALINWGLFYGLTVFLARTLDTRGFHDYSVAVATVTLLTSLASLGLEKYALRILPAAFERHDWAVAQGFLRFSFRSLLLASITVGLLYATVRLVLTERSVAELWPVLAGVSVVPAVAMVQLQIEVLAATGRVVRATFFYRILFPVGALAFICGIGAWTGRLTATQAVEGYAAAWLLTLAALWNQTRKWMPAEVRTAQVVTEARSWLSAAIPFLIHSVMMTQFASLGIIGLEFAGRGEKSVALLAACMQTGSFVVLLATATNRYYSPRGSVLIERQDFAGIEQMILERWRWIIPVTLAYFLGIVLFGRRILGLFGPGFEEGYVALLWIAGGASISVILAMAPVYLKFVRRNGLVLGITAIAATVNFGLILLLGPARGATGAAIAYAVSIGGMAIAFATIGIYSVKRRLPR
jgi:O-antigen/teichoic acid export membrane protein